MPKPSAQRLAWCGLSPRTEEKVLWPSAAGPAPRDAGDDGDLCIRHSRLQRVPSQRAVGRPEVHKHEKI